MKNTTGGDCRHSFPAEARVCFLAGQTSTSVNQFFLIAFLKRSGPLLESPQWLPPERLLEVIRAVSNTGSFSSSLEAYRGLHWLRHEAKKGVDHFVEALERQMPDGGCTLHFPSRTGKAAVPFFNAGTDALAFLREIGKAVLYGDPGENCKKKLVLLFKSQVCNAAGFEIQSALSEWLDPLGDKRLEIQVISSGADDNQYLLGERGAFHDGMLQIVGNALSFAVEKVRVSVFTYPERDPAILVSDDGPGIHPENVERAFTRWSSRPQAGGEGMGLSFDFPYKLGLMGFSLYLRDNRRQWHWICSEDGVQMRPGVRNPLSRLPVDDRERIEKWGMDRRAAFLIVQE